MAMLSLDTLKPARGAKRSVKRVGRGNASGKGTTAGRGTKGQSARTGGRNRLKLIGMKRLILSTPKLRGFASPHAKKTVISVGDLSSAFSAGQKVTPSTLMKKGLVPSGAKVKIVGGGSIRKKIVVIGCSVSEGAAASIKAAGGEIK